jgi:methyl-accepting chemotaxis protein
MKFKMTISFRLWLGFGLLCLFLFAIGLFATSTMSNVNVTTQDMIKRVMPNVSKSQQMKLAVMQFRQYEGDFIHMYPQPKSQEIEKNLTDLNADLGKRLEDYLKSSNSAEGKTAAQKFEMDFGAFIAVHNQIMDLTKSNHASGAQLLYDDNSARFFLQIQNSINELIQISEKEAAAAGNNNQLEYEKGNKVIKVAMLIIVVFSILLSLSTIRAILKPIRKINHVLKDLAEAKGDLSLRIGLRSGDEIEKMGNYLDKVLETIERMVISIRTSTREVSGSTSDIQGKCTQLHTSSEEITAAITHLSDSALLQTEKTQNSQEQVHDYVARLEKVANYAQKTYDVAREANEGSTTGRQQLISVIEHMEQIKQQNDLMRTTMEYFQQMLLRINDMNQMIRSISGQTNILALNAGIEAARAGTQGKGFAVVATEVGKLANATKTSSEQIVDLLGDIQGEMHKVTEQFEQSTQFIVAGSEQMESMRETFTGIHEQNKTVMTIGEKTKEEAEQMVKTIHNIVELFTQIGNLSTEQSSTSQQIAAEAQQQLSSNESIVALTHELSAQASGLQQLVEMFHVRELKAF